MIANVGQFQREIRRDGVLQVQSPVPNIRSCDVAVDSHDGAGLPQVRIVALKSGAAQVAVNRTVVPRKRWKHGEIAGRNRAGSGVPVEQSPSWNARQTETVVEREERLPVHGFINQPTATAQNRTAVARDVPREARPGREILVVRVEDVADTADAFLNKSGSRVRIKVAQQVVF